VVGQLLRYMAWISSKLAAGKKVRGMIVASEITEDLKLATSLIEGVRLWQYRLSFHVDPVAIEPHSDGTITRSF
jgi:endonuclease